MQSVRFNWCLDLEMELNNAGLGIIEDIGVDAIRARTKELVADLIQRLGDAGLEPRVPNDLERHAGIVMLPAKEPAVVVKALKAKNIIIDYRPGALRLSPYFCNTEAENERLVDGILNLTQVKRAPPQASHPGRCV